MRLKIANTAQRLYITITDRTYVLYGPTIVRVVGIIQAFNTGLGLFYQLIVYERIQPEPKARTVFSRYA